MNPITFLLSLDEDERRPLAIAFTGLAVAVGVAHASPVGPVHTGLAAALLIATPVVGLMLPAGATGFLLAAAAGAWWAFRPYDGADIPAAPVVLANRLAYAAVPPLVVDLLLPKAERGRRQLGLLHLYAPAAVMAIGTVVHFALRQGVAFEKAEAEIRSAALVYAGLYGLLLFLALVWRFEPKDVAPGPSVSRAAEFEETGRHGMAARAYERQGELDKAAEAAERAGDWARAGLLHHRAGDDFRAGESYYKAQMWLEALECYERVQAFPAAARLCAQLGQIDRAVAFYERAGDRGAALRLQLDAGLRPSGLAYRQAGMLREAAAAFEESGDLARAAEVWEYDLADPARAAELHLKAGAYLPAGRLLEGLGRTQEALEAYAATPAGSLEAARLYVAAGQPERAAAHLAHLTGPQVDAVQDESTLTLVARVMLESGREDEAVRLLQGLKRRGPAGGTVHLLLARAFLKKGHDDLAEEELRIATSLPLDGADATQAAYLLGRVLENSGRGDEACQVFHDILQKDFHYADVEKRYRRLKGGTAKPTTGA